MDDQAAFEELAQSIAKARLEGRAMAPLPGRDGMSVADGYAIQALVNGQLSSVLGVIGGSKIGASNEALKEYLKIDEPLVGEMFASSMHESPAEFAFSDFQRPGIETEIGVTFGKDVPPGGEWRSAIGSLHAAIEIVDNRYADMDASGAVTFVADNMFNAASIRGPAVNDFASLDLENLAAKTVIDGEVVDTGSSAALMGGPMQTLEWLFDLWRRQDRTARAGWFVSLGTMTMVQWLKGPADVRIEVEGLGEVSCRLR